MKTKKSLKFKIIVPAAALLVLVAGGALAYTLISRPVSADKATSTTTFNFDASKAPGWWTGGTIDSSTDKSADNTPQPTIMMIIGQGSKEHGHEGGDCFVQYEYWANNSKDPEEVVSESATPSDPSTSGTFALQPTNIVSLTIKTPSGDTPFQLHQYNVTGPDASQMSDGEEFGAFKAGTGYIDVRGYCKTADELSVSLPVFSAVSFKL
jgi:hypothetical protein